ncbi:MAG: TRAP transporter substrate-binding protein DctP [Clostridiales Family XIII bacterium]|nr:TRAP transporter substrate-binding protein DctP [Clostridiales Family XIII bacterium]
MSRKTICLIVAGIFCVSMLAACGGGEQAPADEEQARPADAAAETQAPADGVTYTVNVNITGAESALPSHGKVFRELEEASGGRLKFDIFYANSLMAIQDIPKGIQTGVAEISMFPSNNFTSQMPLNSRILQLPFIGLKDPKESVEILTQLQNEFPEMQKEFEDLGMTNLGNFAFPPYHLHFTGKDKEIRVPADVRGMKLITNKIEFFEALTAAGAAPVQMPPPETYSSLEKNVADGYVNNYAFEMLFGLTELVNVHTEFGDYGAWVDFACMVINTDFLNSLPEDLQELIKNTFAEKSYLFSDDQMNMSQEAIDIGVERGNLFVKLTDDELAEWMDLARPSHEKAIEEISKNSPAARAIYERALELIEERFG